jgi:hypothetical protein
MHKEELYNLCSSPKIILAVKSRRVWWGGVGGEGQDVVTCEHFVPLNVVKMSDGFRRFTVNCSLCSVCFCSVSNLATHNSVVALFIV